ncbi:20594_t:CDS:2 [Gigaspora margarita]|uniref:20594_t:CDS:1 n=1 Tax=Gigaspora margarita TaxID=4874 RepID=A0ABM8VZY6_GIGMA|nr:20594_t:CDS:2 [Gigaspora margarita]
MTSTSVKVALRIRPLSTKETIQGCNECLSLIPDAPQQILIGTDRSFTFDYVFPSDTEQEEVFEDCAISLLDKFVEGQTGSGKTYSMGTALDGSNISAEHINEAAGMVPRSIHRLFNDLNDRKSKNPSYQFEVFVTFLELYNEDLVDLLNPQNRENIKKGKNDLMIREDSNGQIYWAGVKEIPVNSPKELLDQLQQGSSYRTVASTDMNMVSSRSHAIFSVILKQTKVENIEDNKENCVPETSSKKKKPKTLTSKIVSKFHFVDLAGSERLKRTNAVGDRAKEGIAINGGLLALGNVISALGDESRKATHVPYRDSKLTRLLQDSLGGNSQTLMLACVSPADSNFMETLNTLKYANRARNIKNKVSVNESYGGNSVEINQLRSQIAQLRMEIQMLRSSGADEENSRKYEEEITHLRGELGLTKMRLQTTEQELVMSNTEKNTLLMEIGFNDQDLSEADRSHKMQTHHIIQAYEQKILDFKNQVADLQAQTYTSPRKSSFAGSTPGREKGQHIKFLDNNSSDDDDQNHEKKIKKKRSRKQKTRADGLRRRSARAIEKAKEQIKQGFLLLKNGGGAINDDPLMMNQLIKTPSSTKSESYIDQMMANHANNKEKRRSSSVSFSDIQTLEVPQWQESNPPPQPSTRRTSNSSRSVSFSDQPPSPGSTKSSQNSYGLNTQQNALTLTRMLHQIQADIAVKEQLVTQLERAEQEFTYMRAEYEQRLAHMQETLITLQRERDTALKRAAHSSTGVSTRDKNSILAELKARYEHKMKKLIQEIGELRRKYNEATQVNATAKSQNESTLKSMRAQIEQLKAEKMRMIKHMKERDYRVREMTERSQREIQNLRRKEKSAQEQKKRLERQSEMQKLMLDKRQKEVLQTTGKLKSVMTLLKRTSTPKSIAKAFRKNRNKTATDSPSRRTSDDISNIYEEFYGSGYDKKKVLDDVINKYITSRQQISLMDELFDKRDNLQSEKKELLKERESIISSAVFDEPTTKEAQNIDDRIEMINSEISYISARIRVLQAEAARNATIEPVENDVNHQEIHEEQQVGDNSKNSNDKDHKNNKSGKSEKKISFSLPTPEASYDAAVSILRNLDSFESQTILESFFDDIVKLRTGEWSKDMTLASQQKEILDLKKSLLAMRRAAVMATAEYEKRNKELEELIRRNTGERDGRSPSPISPESRELHIVGIEDDATNSLSWFERIYETALSQVEVAMSIRGTPTNESGSLSRRNSSYATNETGSLSRRNSSYTTNETGSLSRRNSSYTTNETGSLSRRNSSYGTNENGSFSIRNSSYGTSKDTPINENDPLSRRSSHSNGSRRNSSYSNGSSSKRNSLFVEDDTAIHSSSIETSNTPNVPTRSNNTRPSLPSVWLNTHKETTTESIDHKSTSSGGSSRAMKRDGSNGSNSGSKKLGSAGRRLKRPEGSSTPSAPSAPSTPKEENFPNVAWADERTSSEKNKSTQQQVKPPPLSRRRESFATHSRQNSSSMGFYSETHNREGSRDSGYFSGIDKRRSQSSMAHRESKDFSNLVRQSSYGRSSPESDDNVSVTSERRGHSHVRSETPEGGNVYDRLSRSHTQASSAKNTPTRRLMRHVKQNSGGVNSALAALEGRRSEYETTTEPLTAVSN